jgi:hypothetical protein
MDAITKTRFRNLSKGPRISLLIAGVAVVAVLLTGIVMLRLQASGFFAAADANQASVSGNAKLVDDPSAYGGKVVQFTAPAETPPPPPPSGNSTCPLPKYPSPACTGVPTGTSLTAVNGDLEIRTAGQVISGRKVTGSVVVLASNVVIKNSEIHGEIKNPSGQHFTLEDSTVGPPSGCSSAAAVGDENYSARRVRIRNFGDGFRVSGNNILIEDSFLSLCSNPGDHGDGIQGYFAGTGVTIRHNTIDQRNAVDFTAPIFFADHSKAATIKDNLVMGGVWSLYITYQTDEEIPDTGPWVITGNRIVENTGFYGDINLSGLKCSTSTISDNRLVKIDSGYNITSVGATLPPSCSP